MVLPLFDSRLGIWVTHAGVLIRYLWFPPVLENMEWSRSWCFDRRLTLIPVRNCSCKDAWYDRQHLHGHASVVLVSWYVFQRSLLLLPRID